MKSYISNSNQKVFLISKTQKKLQPLRKGPGTNFDKTGKYTGIGVFTIVAEADGEGATKWGKLKSGVGWISLDYGKKI